MDNLQQKFDIKTIEMKPFSMINCPSVNIGFEQQTNKQQHQKSILKINEMNKIKAFIH